MAQELTQIRREFPRVSQEVVLKASQLGAAMLADAGGRRGALHGRIQALTRSMKVAGPAFTVEVRPGDNLMIHAALALARPGDVIVVDGGAYLGAALTGFLMASQARAAGVAGFVVDGAVRDVDETVPTGFPVFAAGTNPNGPTKAIGGRINWPISVGGVTVNPGDLIIGDADGVVAVSRETAAELVIAAEGKVGLERAFLDALGKGEIRNAWVTEALRSVGVLGPGDSL